MEEQLKFDSIPHGYLLCIKEDCPHAATCLHYLAKEVMDSSVKYWTILSPKYQEASHGKCTEYRSSTKVRYAKGFIKMLKNMTVSQEGDVRLKLQRFFGTRTFYRVRKGERLITPAEQKQMMAILKRCGISLPQEFDDYVDDYAW